MKITAICTPVDCRRGAPMGRPNVGHVPTTITRGRSGRICQCDQVRVYTKRVRLIEGCDIGCAYWGSVGNLYVDFTKDLSYVEFYRVR